MTTPSTHDLWPLSFTPVIILGAGRSGTNALRDMLNALPQISTWPCDEINPIWRHGNVLWPNDEIPPARATPAVVKFIRRAFEKQWKRSGKPAYVLEKTCANTLRVDFIDRVLPQARYIHIVRDGRAVIPSAQKRWRGELEVKSLPYFLNKARFIPLSDIPYFGYTFIRNRMSMIFGATERMSMWGPRFADVQSYQDKPLVDICAAQWAACVDHSDRALAQIDGARVLQIAYEDMTSNPMGTLTQILEFLDPGADVLTRDATAIGDAAAIIRSAPDRKAPKPMPDVSAAVRSQIIPVLKRYGYE